MHLQRPLCLLLFVGRDRQVILNADLSDLYRLVDLLDVPFDGRVQVVREHYNLARCQRAGKSAC